MLRCASNRFIALCTSTKLLAGISPTGPVFVIICEMCSLSQSSPWLEVDLETRVASAFDVIRNVPPRTVAHNDLEIAVASRASINVEEHLIVRGAGGDIADLHENTVQTPPLGHVAEYVQTNQPEDDANAETPPPPRQGARFAHLDFRRVKDFDSEWCFQQ